MVRQTRRYRLRTSSTTYNLVSRRLLFNLLSRHRHRHILTCATRLKPIQGKSRLRACVRLYRGQANPWSWKNGSRLLRPRNAATSRAHLHMPKKYAEQRAPSLMQKNLSSDPSGLACQANPATQTQHRDGTPCEKAAQQGTARAIAQRSPRTTRLLR